MNYICRHLITLVRWVCSRSVELIITAVLSILCCGFRCIFSCMTEMRLSWNWLLSCCLNNTDSVKSCRVICKSHCEKTTSGWFIYSHLQWSWTCKVCPAGGAKGKIICSLKFKGYILWGAGMTSGCFIFAEMSHSEPKCRTGEQTDLHALLLRIKNRLQSNHVYREQVNFKSVKQWFYSVFITLRKIIM